MLYIFVVLNSVATYLYSITIGKVSQFEYSFDVYLDGLIPVGVLTFFLWSCYYYLYLLVNRKAHPIGAYTKKLVSIVLPLHRFIGIALIILVLNLNFSNYTYIKIIIADISPFPFDRLFHDIDVLVHMGIEPWKLTHAVFSNAYGTLFINFLYNLWFFIMWGMFLFFTVYRNNELLRKKFLYSFLLCWLIVGSVAATLMSSAGPCFVADLDAGFSEYIPLMERLQVQNRFIVENSSLELWALDTQALLWGYFQDKTSGIGAGISAMPSMHVSIAVLMAIGAFGLNRYLGYLMILYAVMIQIGSVHLGWHYAIDGYVSIVLTLLIWKAVSYGVDRHIKES